MRGRVNWKRVVLCFFLGIASVAIVVVLNRLERGGPFGQAFEALFLPGVMFSALVSPGGVHGPLPDLWVPAVYVGNLLFYSTIWYLVLTLASKRRGSVGDVSSIF